MISLPSSNAPRVKAAGMEGNSGLQVYLEMPSSFEIHCPLSRGPRHLSIPLQPAAEPLGLPPAV